MARIIDYTPGCFTHYYIEDGAKYCFTVYHEFYVRNKEDDDLDITMHDLVIGVGPQGSYSFRLYYRNGKFEVSKKVKINKQLLEQIIDARCQWTKTHKAVSEYDGDKIIV